MNRESVLKLKKRFVRELWTIWSIQFAALCLGCSFSFIYRHGIIPNYPAWDGVHSICGVLAMACAVIFFIAMLWGGYKIMDTRFLPKIICIYAISLYLAIPVLMLVLMSDPDSLLIRMSCLFLLMALPFYSIISLFFICLWLGGSVEEEQFESESCRNNKEITIQWKWKNQGE